MATRRAAQALAAQAAVLGHVSILFYSEPSVTLAERLCALPATTVRSSATRAPRRSRPPSSWRVAPGRARGGAPSTRSCASRAPSTGAPWRRSRPVGRQPSASRSSPCPRASSMSPRNDLAALAAAVGPGTCAVLVEPIQGEGGVWPIDAAWLELARELCDRHGALLLYDEVQTGIGRCGAWFCAELAGVKPDATAVAKGLAGGFPIGALLASDHSRRRLRARRPRDDLRRLARRSPQPRWRCSMRSSARTSSRTPGRSASTSRGGRRLARSGSRARSRAAARIELVGGDAAEVSEALRARGSSSTRSPRRRCGSCRHCASRRAKPTVSVPLSRMCWPLAATSMPPQWHKPGMR